MSLSPKSGPFISYNPKMLGSIGTQSANLNPDEGTSLFHRGHGLLDPRWQFTFSPGQRPGQNTFGFISNEYQMINQVPSATANANIAASQGGAGAGNFTLVSSSGAGITTGVSFFRPDNNAAVTNALAIDGQMLPFRMGDPINGSIVFWDPTKAVARNVTITSAGTDTGVTFTVSGFDLYGFPMTENITGVAAGTASGNKAFKYVTQVARSASINTTASVGTGDKIGFPLRSDFFGDLAIVYNNTWVTASTGYVAANTTSPATATTGDVRGTMLVGTGGIGTPTNGVIRLQLFLSPVLGNMVSVNGLFGVPQNTALNNGS